MVENPIRVMVIKQSQAKATMAVRISQVNIPKQTPRFAQKFCKGLSYRAHKMVDVCTP